MRGPAPCVRSEVRLPPGDAFTAFDVVHCLGITAVRHELEWSHRWCQSGEQREVRCRRRCDQEAAANGLGLDVAHSLGEGATGRRRAIHLRLEGALAVLCVIDHRRAVRHQGHEVGLAGDDGVGTVDRAVRLAWQLAETPTEQRRREVTGRSSRQIVEESMCIVKGAGPARSCAARVLASVHRDASRLPKHRSSTSACRASAVSRRRTRDLAAVTVGRGGIGAQRHETGTASATNRPWRSSGGRTSDSSTVDHVRADAR